MSIKKSFHIALLFSGILVDTQSHAMQAQANVYTSQAIILKLKKGIRKEEDRARKMVFELEQKVEVAEKRTCDAEKALALLKKSVVTPISVTPVSPSLPGHLSANASGSLPSEDWEVEEAFYFADQASNKLCAPWDWGQESRQAMINYFQKQTAQHYV
jgi:hypothetical protein